MAVSVKYFSQKSLALLALIGISACSSHIDSDKITSAAATPLTAQQKKDALAKVVPHLQGEWDCVVSDGGSFGCFGEKLAFSASLDQLTIENGVGPNNFCRMTTTYQLTMGVEDSSGMTDFTIHAAGLGQLTDGFETNPYCTNFVSTNLTNKPLDENFSFTHNANWSEIVIDSNTFQKNPNPQPSVTPSTLASPAPNASNQLSNS